jgi:uncharacterized membrane protein YbhN (UPF0104 family)
MRNKTQILIRTALSIGASALILGLMMKLLTGSSDADRPQLIAVLQKPAWSFVGVYLLCTLVQTLFRAIRYRILLRAGGEQDVPSAFHMYQVTLVRNMFVDLFPARLGELSYVAMLNRRYKVSGETCMSSFGISFLYDLVALALLMVAVLAWQLLHIGFEKWMLFLLIPVGLVAVGSVLLYRGVRYASGVLDRLLSPRRPGRLLPWLAGFTHKMADAIDITRKAGVGGRVLGLSLLVRVFKYAGLYAIFLAITVPHFPEFASVSPPNAVLAFVGAEATGGLPIPSFMSFGPYEAGSTAVLALMGFSAAASSVAVLAYHIWSQLVDYSLGALGLLTFIHLTGQRTAATTTKGEVIMSPARSRHIGVAAAILLLCAGMGVLALQYRKTKKMGSLNAPDAGTQANVPEDADSKLKTIMGKKKGFVVWSSNRFGNHDILLLTLPNRHISRLTSHPNVDYFPRISPDGKSIVFSRSQVQWVSQRNYVPWDVYLLNMETGKEQRIAKGGNTPTWSEDGSKIYFQRNSDDFVEYDLATAKERTLFGPKVQNYDEGLHLETPQYSAKRERLAVTRRGSRRDVGLFSLDGSYKKLSGGCQLGWAPDASFLFQVDKGGKKKNAIYRYDATDLNKEMLLDLPGDYSHEYFPKVSNDGSLLVLGASAEGHEHDSADYEIFLWPIGKKPEDAVRLTFHTGNDCWPDVWVE